jgi:hypothetical protein
MFITKKITSKFLSLVASLLFIFSSINSQAAIITFADFQHVGSDAIDYIVTIEDDSELGVTSGAFRISYQVDPSSSYTTGKLTGFFLDAEDPFSSGDGPYTSENFNLANETVSSCGQAFNTLSVSASGGCNTNLTLGAGAGDFQGHEWDLAIAWKNNNDLSDGEVQSFEIDALALSLEDIKSIALRGQATTGMGGSAKEFQTAPSPVPLPASGALLLTALCALQIVKRKT